MNRIKSFFTGVVVLITICAMLVLVALIYIAKDRSSIKTYFFQTGNNPDQRIGQVYDVKSIPADSLRDKLIEKYLSEYFKVIPGEKNALAKRDILENRSSSSVKTKWLTEEQPQILEMSGQNMLRLLRVDSITNQNFTASYGNTTNGYYKVKFHTLTWLEPNMIESQPVREDKTIFMEVVFEPGLRKKDSENHILSAERLVKDLKQSNNPAGLFIFYVLDINDQAIKSKEE